MGGVNEALKTIPLQDLMEEIADRSIAAAICITAPKDAIEVDDGDTQSFGINGTEYSNWYFWRNRVFAKGLIAEMQDAMACDTANEECEAYYGAEEADDNDEFGGHDVC